MIVMDMETILTLYIDSTDQVVKYFKIEDDNGITYNVSVYDNKTQKLVQTYMISESDFNKVLEAYNSSPLSKDTDTDTDNADAIDETLPPLTEMIRDPIVLQAANLQYSALEHKREIEWKSLNDDVYNNHFIRGQCQLKVEFNRTILDDGTNYIIRYLPIYPEDITFGATTNYASSEIIGRPGPISGYVSTSDVTTNIVLHLHRELEIAGDATSDKNKIDDLISLIQACAYPKSFQDGLYVPIVTYTFGDTIITGKQTSWNAKWSGPKIGNVYMEVTITVGISHVPMGVEFFDDVFNHNPRQFR